MLGLKLIHVSKMSIRILDYIIHVIYMIILNIKFLVLSEIMHFVKQNFLSKSSFLNTSKRSLFN